MENAAHKALNRLDQVVRGLEELTRKQADKPEIKIDPIGSDLTEKGSQLQNAMDALLDSGEALNQLLSDSADTLIADLKAVNNQFRSITNLIRSEKATGIRIKARVRKIRSGIISRTCPIPAPPPNSMTAGSPPPKTKARSPAAQI